MKVRNKEQKDYINDFKENINKEIVNIKNTLTE